MMAEMNLTKRIMYLDQATAAWPVPTSQHGDRRGLGPHAWRLCGFAAGAAVLVHAQILAVLHEMVNDALHHVGVLCDAEQPRDPLSMSATVAATVTHEFRRRRAPKPRAARRTLHGWIDAIDRLRCGCGSMVTVFLAWSWLMSS